MMNNKFSLVMATYGRSIQVNNFLKSIVNIEYDKSKIEIIIVDQNDKIDLSEIIEKYKYKLNINHIKVNKRGLSYSRNIGIKNATGDIIAFPDDDCEYIKDTLSVVNNYFNNNECDLLMGKIILKDGSNSIRNWPKRFIKVTKSNFYTKCSSVTIFFKKTSCYIWFNEKLGAGTKFGACEDNELIYKNVKHNKIVIYNPEVKIFHPHYNSNHNMSDIKIYNYGLGLGGMIRSSFDINMLILFIQVEVFQLLKIIGYTLIFNNYRAKRSYLAFKARIKGFIEFNEK